MEKGVTTLSKVIIRDYSNYSSALEHLTSQGVKHLGWLNSGIKIPKHYKPEMVFSNRTGTQCLCCDPIHRVSYSVDMGD